MDAPPLEATPVRFPPGRVRVRLAEGHRVAYRGLYARYGSVIGGLPVLRDRDFDGRSVTMTPSQFEALRQALGAPAASGADLDDAFAAQERGRSRLYKRIQYLS